MYNTEKSLVEHKAKLDAATADSVQAAITKTRDAAAKEGISLEELKEAISALEAASMSIGKAVYSSQKPAEGGEGAKAEGGDKENVQEAEQVKPEEKK